MMPARVLQVIPSLSSAHGGPSKAARLFELAFAQTRIQLDTATTDDDGPGRRVPVPIGKWITEEGAHRIYFRKWLDFYKVAPGFAWWIWRHVREYQVVHIHALFSFTSVVAAFAARARGVPYVIRPLGTLNAYGVAQRRSRLKRLSLALFEKRILRGAAAVHFTSDAEWNEARAIGVAMRGRVIALGIEKHPVAQAETRQHDSPTILFLSRLDPKKNVEGLLRAFGEVTESHPHSLLIVAGDGATEYVGSLRELANSLGVADRVAWLGHVCGARKRAVLASATVFALPSYSENFGIAAVEALMSGLPCVLGRGVAIAQDVACAGAGLAVDPNSSSIAAGLLQILGNEHMRRSMSECATRLATERYSLEAMGTQLAQLYGELADPRARRA